MSVVRTVSTAILRGLGHRIAVGAGADGGERHRLGAELVGHLEAAAVAALEQAGLARAPALPDGPDGVDHEPGRQVERRRGLGVAEGAAPEAPARLDQLGAGGPVDGPVDTPAPQERGVGRVDDRVDVLGGDVAQDDLEVRAHEAQRRFPDRGATRPERADSVLGPCLRGSGGSSRREEETPCARVHNRA